MTYVMDAVPGQLEKAETLAEAIRVLRRMAGSHDKFAAQLGTKRQTVIGWEAGVYPKKYVGALRDLGVPDRLLRPKISLEAVEARLRKVEAEAAQIRQLLAELR